MCYWVCPNHVSREQRVDNEGRAKFALALMTKETRDYIIQKERERERHGEDPLALYRYSARYKEHARRSGFAANCLHARAEFRSLKN